MNKNFNEDPKITYALIKLEDVLAQQLTTPHPDFIDITHHKGMVLTRYQPVFSLEHIPRLSKAEFESFLLFRNNHHWNNLHRVGKFMTEDMSLLREALTILLDENQSTRDRLNRLRPERYWGEHSMVSYLGIPVLSAILQISQPDLYGIWNNTSDESMKMVKLWNPKWEYQHAGDSYEEMNAIFLYLAMSLGIDLWTLDALWWVMKKGAH